MVYFRWHNGSDNQCFFPVCVYVLVDCAHFLGMHLFHFLCERFGFTFRSVFPSHYYIDIYVHFLAVL